MVGKLALNSTHFTRGLVKYVPGRGYFRVVLFQNGDKFAISLTPPIVERLYCLLAHRTGVLLGAEKFMASWHKSEEEASKLREVNRAA